MRVIRETEGVVCDCCGIDFERLADVARIHVKWHDEDGNYGASEFCSPCWSARTDEHWHGCAKQEIEGHHASAASRYHRAVLAVADRVRDLAAAGGTAIDVENALREAAKKIQHEGSTAVRRYG